MKRIILCADGTWNDRDQTNRETGKRRPTNVTKIARAVRPTDAHGVSQVVFYGEGVGTNPGMDRITGGAFGHGMEQDIIALYRCLLYNYEPGDEIFLFGFSRGAFTARSLVGFIKFAGLLQKDDDYYTPDFYACYQARQGRGTKLWEQANHNVRDTRPCPQIRMVGVWDTVGALGAPGFLGRFNRGKYQYHDVGLHPEVQNAYHALAIDERRKPFAPTLWHAPAGWSGTLEQVWFAGVHSNVGGGYTPDGLANLALDWIAAQAARLGLALDRDYLKPFEPHHDSKLHDSMTLAYRALGAVVREVGAGGDTREAVHASALKRRDTPALAYAPPNLPAYLARPDHRVVETQWPA